MKDDPTTTGGVPTASTGTLTPELGKRAVQWQGDSVKLSKSAAGLVAVGAFGTGVFAGAAMAQSACEESAWWNPLALHRVLTSAQNNPLLHLLSPQAVEGITIASAALVSSAVGVGGVATKRALSDESEGGNDQSSEKREKKTKQISDRDSDDSPVKREESREEKVTRRRRMLAEHLRELEENNILEQVRNGTLMCGRHDVKYSRDERTGGRGGLPMNMQVSLTPERVRVHSNQHPMMMMAQSPCQRAPHTLIQGMTPTRPSPVKIVYRGGGQVRAVKNPPLSMVRQVSAAGVCGDDFAPWELGHFAGTNRALAF